VTCGHSSRLIFTKSPFSTFENTEGGILGAAILAGVGVGVYAQRNCGRPAVSANKDHLCPDEALADRYNYQFSLFKEIHDLLQNHLISLPGCLDRWLESVDNEG